MEEYQRLLRKQAVPVLTPILAGIATVALWPLGQPVPFVAFIAAVILGAWHSGMRGSFVVTGISALILIVLHSMRQPELSGEIDHDFVVRLAMFVFMGVAAGYLAMQCKRAIGAFDRLQHTLSASGDAWIFADTHGRVTFLNPLAQAWTGWSQSNAVGRPLEQLLVLLHESTREPIALSPAQVVQQGATATLPDDTLLLAAGGMTIPVEGSIRPIRDSDDHVIEIMLSLHDVTHAREVDHKLAETHARYEAMSRALPAGLLSLAPDGQCLQANDRGEVLCGCATGEMLGQGWARYVHPQDRNALLEGLLAAVSEGREYLAEFRVWPPTGEHRWLRLRTSPQRSSDGALLGHVGLLDDVTGPKQMEMILHEARTDACARIDELTAHLDRSQTSLVEARQQFEQQLNESRSQHTAAEAAREVLQRQLREQGKQLQEAEAGQKKAQAELERQLRTVQSQLGEREKKLNQIREELAAKLQKETEARQYAEQLLESTCAQLETQLAQRQAEVQEAQAALERAHTDLDQARRATAEGRDAAERHHAAEVELGKQLAALEAARAELEQRLKDRETVTTALSEDCRRLQAQLEQAQAEQRRTLEQADRRLSSHRTDWQQQVESLRESLAQVEGRNEFALALLDGNPQGIAAFDAEHRVTYWNPALAALTGRGREEMLGQSIHAVFPELPVDGQTHRLRWSFDRVSVSSTLGSLLGVGTPSRGVLELVSVPLSGPRPGGLVILWAAPSDTERPEEPHEAPEHAESARPSNGSNSSVGRRRGPEGRSLQELEWLAYN